MHHAPRPTHHAPRLTLHALRSTLLATLVLLAGCDLYSQDEFESEVVVESVLVAAEPLTEVRLSRTVDFDEVYVFEERTVSGATVEMRRFSSDGSVAETIRYAEETDGIYLPAVPHDVVPLATYELFASVPGQAEPVRARTVVPDTFSVVRVSKQDPVYIRDEAPALDVTQSAYPGRQNIYIFSVEALEPENYALTPIRQDRVDNDDSVTAEDFIISTSPILFEGNYEVNDDGTVGIFIPWLAISYYGPTRASAYALDNGVYDFFRSLDVQFGISTLSPGELQNVIEHVENGTGLFGSVARVEADFFIRER